MVKRLFYQLQIDGIGRVVYMFGLWPVRTKGGKLRLHRLYRFLSAFMQCNVLTIHLLSMCNQGMIYILNYVGLLKIARGL